MLLVGGLFSLASCKGLERRPDVGLIGCGYIKYDQGIYYVEIDSVKYSPNRIYTNVSTRDGKTMMTPVDGMQITCFRLNDNPKVEFIVGEQSQEYLEHYFAKNYTFLIMFIGGIILAVVICLLISNKMLPKAQ